MPLLPPTSARFRQILTAAGPLVWHLLNGRPLPLSTISRALFRGQTPPARVLGVESISQDKPFVLICNHYESPRVAAWWGPAFMSRIVAEHRIAEPREVHWVMASEWTYTGGFGRYVKQPLTELVFPRIGRVLELVLVPPVLTGDPNRGQGVAGVRHGLALTRGPSPQLIGIAPEGHTGPQGQLKEPPPGGGLFLLLLTHDTIPCLPVGWFDDEQGTMTIHFGAPFRFDTPHTRDRDVRDRAAATQAMMEIGKLLPEHLWGAYRERIAELCAHHS